MTEDLESYADSVARRCKIGSVREEIREVMASGQEWGIEPRPERVVEVLEALSAIGKVEEIESSLLC